VHTVLAARGIPLACNEVGFSLLRRDPEHNGLLDVSKELGVTIIVYQPLASGMMSGKYDSEHRPSGIRRLIYNSRYLTQIQPLLEALKRIADARGKTVSQVSLNWILCKGVLPIPGAKSPEQAPGISLPPKLLSSKWSIFYLTRRDYRNSMLINVLS
jgi:aryl-alcohol dehydrogenase-like predicted oxidoreductase